MTDLPDLSFRLFDFEDPQTFAPALRQVTHLFLIAPPASKDVRPMIQLLHAARDAGIQHITLHSGRTTGDIPGSLLNELENLLRRSELNHTILRPGWFMQNFAAGMAEEIRAENAIFIPAGKGKAAFIDARDIAAVVEQSFLHPAHNRKLYELTSEESMDLYEVARLFSEMLDRKIEYIDLAPEKFIRRMMTKGWSEEAAAFHVYLYDLVGKGKEEGISRDVSHILGRPPITFRRFLKDYRHHWTTKNE
jgi:uncharacterized protein YbjT (DUF2867 family)